MEKPVRIVTTEKMRDFNEKVRNGLEHALNFMLASEDMGKVILGAFEPFLMPIETYLSAYKKKSVLVKIHSDKAFEGQLYWFFEMKSAVVLGGLLRMLPPSALAEKVDKGDFDASDQDAFGEVGNQLCGILDRAFRTLTHKDIHLKMDFNRKIYPDESIKLETFVNLEEYVVLLSDVTMPLGHGKQKLTLLLPRTLYEVLLNLELALDGITPKVLLVYSWNSERVEHMQAKLNSRYTKVVKVDRPEDVLERLSTPNLTAIAIDLPALNLPLNHAESLLFKRFMANRSFMRVPLFLTCDNANEEAMKEVRQMGLGGATKNSFLADFPPWAQAFTHDPSVKA